MPYSLESNDTVIFATEKQESSAHHHRMQDTVADFEEELAEQPRVFALPLHPCLSGVPHRFLYLTNSIDMLMARSDTMFMNGAQIADWFVKADAETGD